MRSTTPPSNLERQYLINYILRHPSTLTTPPFGSRVPRVPRLPHICSLKKVQTKNHFRVLFIFLDINMHSIMVDPRLAMPFHDFLNKPQKPSFAIPPSIWDQQLDTSILLFDDQIDLDNSTEAKDDDVEMVGLCTSHAAGIKKSSRALSNSSIPSLTSSSSSQSSHQTKKQARKPKTKKRQQQLNQELVRDVSRTKRKQYLERNRIAASKCRQKKKDWMHELEETERLLQSKHHNLQHEYSTVSEAVFQMKNLLMAHWSCRDHDIDQWINDEARKFVQQSTDGSMNGLGDHTFRSNRSGILSLSAPSSRHQTPNSLISSFPSNSIYTRDASHSALATSWREGENSGSFIQPASGEEHACITVLGSSV
ncbi:hypothetical protein V2G26_019071 [Clonostachys chloroleuca]